MPPYQPPLLLSSGHANTIWANIRPSKSEPTYRRERFETSDGDFVDLDWVDGPPSAPLLIALHGLEGDSRSPYIVRLMDRARRRNWRGVVLNARGCSGEDNRRLESYNAGQTQDLAEVMRTLRGDDAPLLAVGYSLGANQLANYLGRHTEEVPPKLRGAYLVSAPLLLEPSAEALQRRENRFYTWYFLLSLRRKLRRKGLSHPEAADRVRRALEAKSIVAFDEHWTAPLNGYHDAQDYYARAAAGPYLESIQVPTAILHAADDPFVPPECVPRERIARASLLELDWHEKGGHVGFVHASDPHWLEERILDWLSRQAAAGV